MTLAWLIGSGNRVLAPEHDDRVPNGDEYALAIEARDAFGLQWEHRSMPKYSNEDFECIGAAIRVVMSLLAKATAKGKNSRALERPIAR